MQMDCTVQANEVIGKHQIVKIEVNNFCQGGYGSCLRKIKQLILLSTSSEPHDVQRPLWWSTAPSSA
jgi:hypothetical protein